MARRKRLAAATATPAAPSKPSVSDIVRELYAARHDNAALTRAREGLEAAEENMPSGTWSEEICAAFGVLTRALDDAEARVATRLSDAARALREAERA